MTVNYNKKFLKDLASLPKKDRNKIEAFVFEEISAFSNSSLVLNL